MVEIITDVTKLCIVYVIVGNFSYFEMRTIFDSLPVPSIYKIRFVGQLYK